MTLFCNGFVLLGGYVFPEGFHECEESAFKQGKTGYCVGATYPKKYTLVFHPVKNIPVPFEIFVPKRRQFLFPAFNFGILFGKVQHSATQPRVQWEPVHCTKISNTKGMSPVMSIVCYSVKRLTHISAIKIPLTNSTNFLARYGL